MKKRLEGSIRADIDALKPVEKKKSYFLFILLFCMSSCATASRQGPSVQERAQARQLIAKGVEYLREYDKGREAALEEASAAFELAFILDRESPETLDAKGCVAWRKGDVAGAEFLFSRALEVDPTYARAWVHRAYIEEMRGQVLLAKDYLNKALRLNAFDPHALNNLGGLSYDFAKDVKEKESAKKLIYQAKELSPPESVVIKKNIKILTTQGR